MLHTEEMERMRGMKDKDDEIGILWNDSELKIKWPIKNPIISQKDRKLRTFYDFKKFYKGF